MPLAASTVAEREGRGQRLGRVHLPGATADAQLDEDGAPQPLQVVAVHVLEVRNGLLKYSASPRSPQPSHDAGS